MADWLGAATLFERQEDEIGDARLERWSALLGGREALARRLAWRVAVPPRAEERWRELFEAGLARRSDAAARMHRGERPPGHHPEHELPFEWVLAGFTLAGAEALQRALTPEVRASWLEGAIDDLSRWLALWVTGLAARAMYAEFVGYRGRRRKLLERLRPAPGTRIYRAFVDDMHSERLPRFFEEYPVLARLLGTAMAHWLDAASELTARVAADRGAIATRLGAGRDTGAVAACATGLSDPHHGGRSVARLRFASGLEVFYKPRSLALDVAFGALVGWCNERADGDLELRAAAALDRGSYGFAEAIAPAPCESAAEARGYFVRAGMLLALLHLLGATDGHHENLIAAGACPVAIDLETLMCPTVAALEDLAWEGAPRLVCLEHLQRNVLRTGLLPCWELDAQGEAQDYSGLGAASPAVPDRAIDHINSDAMQLGHGTTVLRQGAHSAHYNGQILHASDYAEEVADGFARMYRRLASHKEMLLAPASPLEAMRGARARIILRPSSVYAALLGRTLEPAFLRDGRDRSIELDVLCRSFLGARGDHPLAAIIEHERQALEELDLPRFEVDLGERHIVFDGVRIEGCLVAAGADVARAAIAALDEVDLARQLALVRKCLAAARDAAPATTAAEPEMTAALPDLAAEARAIAARLLALALPGPGGAPTWFELAPVGSRLRLQPMGPGLYDGTSGVALFLAAAAAVSGAEELHAAALATLAPLRATLGRRDGARRLVAAEGIGGGGGAGSIVYALTRAAGLLGDDTLLEPARRLALELSDAAIAADGRYDLIFGSAGMVLGLLALHERLGEPLLLERACRGARHLLASRSAAAGGRRVWRTLEGRHLTGLAHGAAGMALALGRLHLRTGEREHLQAAAEALAYEVEVTEHYHDEATSWCHGASGSGLALLEGRGDYAAAIAVLSAAAAAPGHHGVDHLCCGNLGRVGFLAEASRRLESASLRAAAERIAAATIARARRRGDYQSFVDPRIETVPNAGLFRGLAGVGYGLLHLAAPERIPCLLSLA